MLRVRVDAWQRQRCGTPSAVGDVVRGTLLEQPYDDVRSSTGRVVDLDVPEPPEGG